jgi:hypothetical protein
MSYTLRIEAVVSQRVERAIWDPGHSLSSSRSERPPFRLNDSKYLRCRVPDTLAQIASGVEEPFWNKLLRVGIVLFVT